MKRLFCIPFALALGGCNFGLGFMEKNYVSRSETIPVTAAPASATGTIPVNAASQEDSAMSEARRIAALLLPEGAGPLVRVREKHFANGTRQEIIIATDKGTYGENVIDVSVRTMEASARHANPLTIGPPSENGIRNEILSRFPDVQMNIVTRPMRNGLGPFGLAIGRHSAGARCVFAWQWIEDLRESSPGSSNLTKLNAMMAGRSLATSVRIRLCRNDSTVDQLAAHIEGLRVGSASALERIASMDRRDIDGEPVSVSGTRSTPLVKPVTGSLEAAITRPIQPAEPPKQVARAKPAPAPAPPRRVAQAAPAPKPQRAPRPAPPPEPAAAPQVQVQPAPVYAPAPTTMGGRKYLAPVAGMAPPPPAYGAAAPAAVPPGASMGLPPQAYRGPGYQ